MVTMNLDVHPTTGRAGVAVADSRGVFLRAYQLDPRDVAASAAQIVRHSEELNLREAERLGRNAVAFGVHERHRVQEELLLMALRNYTR